MEEYLNIFIDGEYPEFIDKYLNTPTLQRIKFVTQFCGCDYTKLYSPAFMFSRFDHSLVVAHMTWHFTHDKKETIAALLHDVGTPCFAHCIDYVFGDYTNQESSEKTIVDMIKKDLELQKYLQDDGINISDLYDLNKYHILENKSPKLCTDRLDGVFHSCYIWLHTHTLEQIKEVYDDIVVLINEDNNPEIGFKNKDIALKFVDMVYIYARELQGNKDKYIMKFVSEIVKSSFDKGLITLEDLYSKKESILCDIFDYYFQCWKIFNNASELIRTDTLPNDVFYISFETKKRNTIPLVIEANRTQRINAISEYAYKKYSSLKKDTKYAYIKELKSIENI